MGDLHVMRDDLRPPEPPPRRHLISIGDLTREDVERLLGTARTLERSLDRLHGAVDAGAVSARRGEQDPLRSCGRD